MMVIFRRLSMLGKIGLIAGLIGGLAGAAVAIIADPLFGTAFTLILAAIIYFTLRMSFGSVIRQGAREVFVKYDPEDNTRVSLDHS
jgi:hypothetical protein